MKKYEGSCGCGSIGYSFEGEPANSADAKSRATD